MVLKNMKLEGGSYADFTSSFQSFSVCLIHLGALTIFKLQKDGFLGRWGVDCEIGGLGIGSGGARWDGGSAAAPGGSARDEKWTRFLSRFLAARYTEIEKTATKKRDSFQVQKMDLKMGPFFGLTTGNLYKSPKNGPIFRFIFWT